MKMLAFAAVAATALVAMASPAAATDFSFTGNLANQDTVQTFDFVVGALSNVTLRTYSYAGGTNAAGTVIARGGFDPILSLYDTSNGNRVAQNDDGGCGQVNADAVSGRCWDTSLTTALNAGTYRVAISMYDNFGPANLSGTFPGVTCCAGFDDVSGVANNPRDSHWAFDVLNVESASQGGAAPEPATWAMMIGGLGLAGATLRHRRRLAVA